MVGKSLHGSAPVILHACFWQKRHRTDSHGLIVPCMVCSSQSLAAMPDCWLCSQYAEFAWMQDTHTHTHTNLSWIPRFFLDQVCRRFVGKICSCVARHYVHATKLQLVVCAHGILPPAPLGIVALLSSPAGIAAGPTRRLLPPSVPPPLPTPRGHARTHLSRTHCARRHSRPAKSG